MWFYDIYGHQAGDRCLQSVAQVIGEATVGTSALSASYGGEEFVVVLPGVPGDSAVKVAEASRLRVRALTLPHVGASRGFVTVSAGVASRTNSIVDETSLVRNAVIALYQAKKLGRNRVVNLAKDNASLQIPSEEIVQPASRK